VFVRLHHWPITWARCIQSAPFHPISLRSILILSSHPCLCFPSGHLPSDFLTNILCTFHLSHMCFMPHPLHPPLFDHPNDIWWST
jgi:hypothetical protein